MLLDTFTSTLSRVRKSAKLMFSNTVTSHHIIPKGIIFPFCSSTNRDHPRRCYGLISSSQLIQQSPDTCSLSPALPGRSPDPTAITGLLYLLCCCATILVAIILSLCLWSGNRAASHWYQLWDGPIQHACHIRFN